MERQTVLPQSAQESSENSPTLTLIDASGYVFRAYHALPPLSTSKGVPTQAVLGFTRMLLKTLREHAPTHVALCFDKDSRRGRLEIDPNYKANREAPPDDLVSQFELIRKVAGALNIPVIEYAGWEADDVIATLALKARQQGFRVRILASDKDFIQLLDGAIELFDPVKEKLVGPKEAEERYGVKPSQMCDYLALVGDAIDNVAKVPGIGPKTAVELLTQFGNVETLLNRLDEVKKPKMRDAIQSHAESLQRAKKLVTFKVDLPLEFDSLSLARKEINAAETRALFSELEFFKMIQELPSPPAAQATVLTEEIQSPDALKSLVDEIHASGRFAVVPAVTAAKEWRHLWGLAIALPSEKCFFVSLKRDLLASVSRAEIEATLFPVLADASIKKDGHDLKSLTHLLEYEGAALEGIGLDVELLSYLLNAARREHALADIARERLNIELSPMLQHPDSMNREDMAAALGAAADAVRRLAPLMVEEIDKVGLEKIAHEIELPLIPVLAAMESRGIRLDLDVLRGTAKKVERACEETLAEIYRLAGREFNVASPAQLAQVLFHELNLPVIKKGKTGPSTDQEVLEKLSAQHPLPRAIMEYRNVAKLKSTYLDTLPGLVDNRGRVHTTLHQVAASTGRLSSTDPNLQNIPIRTELGKEIRRAFVAESGRVLMSADYSQLELRILAHIAQDATLVDAFKNDEDVHSRTASEVFGVSLEGVTDEMRRAAKMVNYGIAYGLSPHGLASRLDIPIEEAKSIIDRYFARYTGIHRYLEDTVAHAHKVGFVETLLGRRRYIPDLKSKNRNIALAAERAAINMPIQGTAADLIKVAMLQVARKLEEERLQSVMLLQVHDELLLEVPTHEVERVREIVVGAMSGAAALRVPLKVDVGVGHSWAEAH